MAGRSRILALGHHQPDRVLSNAELAQRLDTSDQWIRERVGVADRHIAGPDEPLTELATTAARNALAKTALDGMDLDLIVVATTSQPHGVIVARDVAANLGAVNAFAYDLNTACSGFCYGLAQVDQAISAGAARHALLIGAERYSSILDWTDRNTCVIFGDGAGAAVIGADAKPGIGPVVWGSAPELGAAVVIDGEPTLLKMKGQMVYRWAITSMPDIAQQACRRAGVALDEIVAFVPHQANIRIIDQLTAKIGLSEQVVVATDLRTAGNTAAASIPLALSKMVDRREVPKDSPALVIGFGGGLTYAAQVLRTP